LLFAKRGKQLFFGLPGNPLACLVGFHRYIAAAIRKWKRCEPAPATGSGTLSDSVRINGPRTVFMLAHVEGDEVQPLPGVGSADIYSTVRANALLTFAPEAGEIAAGTGVDYEWLAWNRRD
jgi:molybdopterin biosynthesis enzyme